MIVRIKRLCDTATLPVVGSKYSAGSDLFACLDRENKSSDAIQSIAPHSTVMIPTGIAIEIEPGYFGAIFARSGLAKKNGLRPANCVGVVDSDYRGEVMVALHNDTDLIQSIEDRERIAQLVIMPYETAEFEEVKELSDTERGDGGFGSSGTKEVKERKRKVHEEYYGEW